MQRGRPPRGERGSAGKYECGPDVSVRRTGRHGGPGHGPAVADAGQPAGGESVHLAAVDRRGVRDLRVHGGVPDRRRHRRRARRRPVVGHGRRLPRQEAAQPAVLATGPTRPCPTPRPGTCCSTPSTAGPATRRSRCAASTTPRRCTASRCARRVRPPGTARRSDADARRAPPPDRRPVEAQHRRGRPGRASRVEVRDDLDAVRTMHDLHVRLRKNKYRLLAQPWEFFERIWQEFAPGRPLRHAARPRTATRSSQRRCSWSGTGSSTTSSARPIRSTCEVRPNDAIYWSAIQLGLERGLGLVDWGLSDLRPAGPGPVQAQSGPASERPPAHPADRRRRAAARPARVRRRARRR